MSSVIWYPKPPILEHIPDHGHLVIEASAGTGKTYTLEHLVIELLLTTRVPLDQFLVVTFTEKAATELRARLRRKLTDILDATKDLTDDRSLAWCIDDDARGVLLKALMSFDAASICTIHAFCHRILTENAFEHQRLFQEELVDSRSVFTKAFLSALRYELATDPELSDLLEHWLDAEPLDRLVELLFDAHQRRGAFYPAYEPVEIRRLVDDLLRQKLTPHVLKPSLRRTGMAPNTQKAVLERVAVLRRCLEGYQKDRRLTPLLAALSREESDRAQGFLRFLTARLSESTTRTGVLTHLLEALEALRTRLVSLPSAIVQSFLPVVRARLTDEKSQRGQIDFDDMLELLHDSLEGPQGPHLQNILRSRFRFGLIDEFQDTDKTQWAIFQRLFLDNAPAHRLFVIGDPKQAIYGFRGADVHTYLEARHHLAQHHGRIVPLTENHRSSPPLIEAINQILLQEKMHPFFTGDIRYDHAVTPGRTDAGGLAWPGRPSTPVHIFHLQSKRGTFGPRAARRTLGHRIAAEVHQLLKDGTEVRWQHPDGPRPLSAQDIYILTRSTQEGLEMGQYLREARVPFSFYKQDGLFQTKEAEDVRAVLAAIAEPHRRSRRLRAWHSPFFAVSLERLADCVDLPPSHPLMSRLSDWKELADQKNYDRLFTRIIETSGIIERELFLRDNERELTNYLHIFEILLEEASKARGPLTELIHTLGRFIDKRSLPEGENGNIQRLESERDAVQIMTMHKAKGLEAAVVFLFGGFETVHGRTHVFHEGGRRLLYVGDERPQEVETEAAEEDQRLLYVAMTRAKARLYVPYFGRVEGPGEMRELRPFNGSYRPLNAQLDELVDSREPQTMALFSIEPVPEISPRLSAPSEDVKTNPIATWQPPSVLLTPPHEPTGVEALKRNHAGFVITSYSRIKAAKGGYQPTVVERLEPEGSDERVLDRDAAFDPETDHQLPAGTASGRFLHEMLELAALDAVIEAPSWNFWGARRDIRTLFETGLRKYDRSLLHYMHAVQLVYTGLRAPLRLGKRTLPGGLATAERVVREMEFLYPLPHPPPHRGFIKGFIDVVFEHEGLIYLLDWKSDLLPTYDDAEIRAHVDHSYRIQAELYTLALVKLLGITSEADYDAKFGGLVYGFVRGMQLDGKGVEGIYFDRPTYQQVAGYEAEWADLDVSIFLEASAA